MNVTQTDEYAKGWNDAMDSMDNISSEQKLKLYYYENKTYILDGNQMWLYNGKTIKKVKPFIPTIK